jgi:hypothetical protein
VAITYNSSETNRVILRAASGAGVPPQPGEIND